MEQKKFYSIPGLCLSGSLDKVECCKTTETYQKKGGKKALLQAGVGHIGGGRVGSIPTPVALAPAAHFW